MLYGRKALALCCFLLPATAAAEPQFTAEDIIKHFAKQNEVAAKPAAAEESAAARGVVINGRQSSIEKPNFRGVTGAGSKVKQTVLSDGLVIPLTGAGRKTANTDAPTRTATAAAEATGPTAGAVAAAAPAKARSGYDLLVTFELASDQLTPQAQTNLRQFAIALQTPALAAFRFEVEGHTDASGSAAKNMKLSEQRAETVVSFLTRMGVQGDRLTAKGYGETRPLLTDPNDPGNRRVETRRIE